jgi:hypothetical protein
MAAGGGACVVISGERFGEPVRARCCGKWVGSVGESSPGSAERQERQTTWIPFVSLYSAPVFLPYSPRRDGLRIPCELDYRLAPLLL